MSKIVHLQKRLIARPEPVVVSGVAIRPIIAPVDVDAWLELREAAFSGLVAVGRRWVRADFEREFAASRVWLAVPASRERERLEQQILGAVALGRAGCPPHDRPSLQWLMVDPSHRRRGIGAALVALVEQAAWDAGEREVRLETHIDWRDAMRLYERCGYAAIE